MKTIKFEDQGLERPGLRHQRVTVTGAKRHPVVFHSRKRYAEAEEEE